MPHSIRLKGPWALSVIQGDTTTDSFRCTPPHDWTSELGSGFQGVVEYERKFNSPTNLNPNQVVELVVGAVDYCGFVILNGQKLGAIEFENLESRFQIQEELVGHNRLQIRVEMPADVSRKSRGARSNLGGGLLGEVRLDIYEADRL